MPYKITDNCIACGDCMVACEKDAIDDGYFYNTTGDISSTTDVVRDGTMEEQETSSASSFRIIESECDDCGFCVSVCPSGAIIKK
jgi:ferredoxin